MQNLQNIKMGKMKLPVIPNLIQNGDFLVATRLGVANLSHEVLRVLKVL